MMARSAVYFTDENTLGLGKLLGRAGRDDVVYPGHDELPEVPLGTPDLEWMPVVGQRRLIVVTRDRRSPTSTNEPSQPPVMNRSSVRFRQAAPRDAPRGHRVPPPGFTDRC